MTINELITKIREEKYSSFEDDRLLALINEIEGDVADQLAISDFNKYTSIDDTDLLVPEPYDRLYESYLKARIDYANEEYASYQNNQAQHVQDFRDFVDWVVRTEQAVEAVFPTKIRNIL